MQSNEAALLVFKTPFWVNLPSDPDASVLLKPMSYGDIYKTKESILTSSKFQDLHFYSTPRSVLHKYIIDTRGIHNFPSIKTIVENLPKEDIIYLEQKLRLLSIPTEAQYEELVLSLEVQFDPRFRDEHFNCTKCKERKFDIQRACKFLPPEEHVAPFRMRVKDQTYTNCPLSVINMQLVQQAHTAYELYSSGFLPEDGGIGEQTMWFVKAAQIYGRQVKIAESDMIKARNNT